MAALATASSASAALRSRTAVPGTPERPTTPAAALRTLAAGNERWLTLHETHPDEDQQVRTSLLSSQHPFALILGCIDSRVPPELVYDQGLGDLMTVRSAGEVLDEAVLGSVAYGVLELDIPLVVVLGHASCGAVTAAVEADETGEPLPAHISYVARRIRPAIDHRLHGQARIDAAISANVRLVRRQLVSEPELAERLRTGKLDIVGSLYELKTQKVHRVG
ncbi:carbonic anhydrase [Streptomyces sp. TS71-3]|uniref:carbonic anhydrase n=1 Tax=Streptomyces sp. TS71-3 TaxID=2733862 RepID=UPI001BB45A24|nr:carbonic anhydrase [Streptomyces sp. TS71-3]